MLCVRSEHVGGTRNRRRGQHQGGMSIPPSKRFRGEGRIQIRGQVSIRERRQLHFYRGKFSHKTIYVTAADRTVGFLSRTTELFLIVL